MDKDERSAVSPSLVEDRRGKASFDPPETQSGYPPAPRDLQHAGEIRRYSFKGELKIALNHYLRLHEAMSRDLRHPCSQIVLEDAHIVRTRLESLGQDVASSKPRLLSAPRYSAGVSAVHELVERFLEGEPKGLTLSGFRSYLCTVSSIERFSTTDLWSIPDCLSIQAIDYICTSARSTSTADSGVERIGALHSLLAELQNTQWLKVMSDISRLDPILNSDPSADFHRMDAETKDAYRRAVAKMAQSFRLPEETIALSALDLARRSARDERVERTHVGYYLIGQGVDLLRSRLRLKRAVWHYFSRSTRNRTLLLLVMAVVAVIFGVYASRAIAVNLNDTVPATIRMLLGFASTVLCSAWLIWCFKTIVTIFISPSKIPCLDYSEGVPLRAKTLVVIPCLLSEASDPIRMKERLLMQFLRNRAKNVSYALLTDWADSGNEVHAEDEELLASASIMIGELNTAYGSKDAGFLLLHRPRIWSDREGVWMGKARKYGKLLDLNRLLATGNEDGFSTICGDRGLLREVKYVITIDNDADLPYGIVARMIATIDHPLNRPRLSASQDRVASGFGLLQPHISVLALKDDATRYEAAIAHGRGLKVYQSPCPGFYSDFLDAGSYVGKGIYDVRCANAVLPQLIDCEKVLSHDLLEGGALNATTISNVDIFESAPKSYGSEMARQSRWIRGDTQNLLWVLGNPSRMQRLGPLTVWKVIECFAGHLVDPCLLLIAVLSCAYADTAWLALFVAGALFFPSAMRAARRAILRLLSAVPIDGAGIWKAVLNDFQIAALRSFTLPHRAVISLTSIFVSSYRFIFSKKKLLEWSTFDQVERSELSGRSRDYFVVNCAFAVMALLLGLRGAPINMSIGICFAASWLLALPMIRYLNSRYRLPSTAGQDDLGIAAWRTWSFFRRAFSVSQSKLVPDSIENNWSDRRTSPTNIGMSLVALVSAQKLSLGPVNTNGLSE
ncbi:hypothetical protein [Xanthomonas graminis]|uniref:hypothetical protein n=1 Tax=Xanthomonas graminis TaxID=3390026 RepID=UPI000AF0D8BC|nr:hypothetical protein [Xanthomonas translucens]